MARSRRVESWSSFVYETPNQFLKTTFVRSSPFPPKYILSPRVSVSLSRRDQETSPTTRHQFDPGVPVVLRDVLDGGLTRRRAEDERGVAGLGRRLGDSGTWTTPGTTSKSSGTPNLPDQRPKLSSHLLSLSCRCLLRPTRNVHCLSCLWGTVLCFTSLALRCARLCLFSGPGVWTL